MFEWRTVFSNDLKKMMAVSQNTDSLSEVNFKEKVRCGEVYRNLHGNEMFQKFYYRCLECSIDYESSAEFEEHVLEHVLQEDTVENIDNVDSLKTENIINISSDEDEEENDYLYAFEVASIENISENDLPLPLMQMLSEQSADSCDKTVISNSASDEDGDEHEKNIVFPCDGLRRQALHVFSEHVCSHCPAYFSTKSELVFHLHVHTLPNTVVCPHCYEAFPNEVKLNEHSSLMRRKRAKKSKNIESKRHEEIQICKKSKNDIHEKNTTFENEVKEDEVRQNTQFDEKIENDEESSRENGSENSLRMHENDTFKNNTTNKTRYDLSNDNT